jgi:preprotein translocase subunit SecG
MLSSLSAILLTLLCVIIILLILIQRGKGGGLAGAFGGMGGQSAFGTKAGDTFMRITIVFVAIWFVMCLAIHIAWKPTGKQDSGMNFGKNQTTTTDSGAGNGADTATEQ